jgi:hypothetical protein
MYCRRTCLLMLVVVLWATAACQPVPPPAVATAKPAALVPMVAVQPTAMTTTGKSVTGRVMWGLAPVPGGRVELRRPDWRTNPDSLIMQAEADDAGAYGLANPPVGDYEVVPAWPEGVTDGAPLAPGMPVTITAGQDVVGIDVYLAKKLKLLEPAAGTKVSAAPTLRWEAFPNAWLYRVIVTDFATMEGFFGEDTTATSLTGASPLPPARKLTLVVNALAEAMSLLAVDSREFTVEK